MKIIYFYQYFGTPKGSWSTRVYELTRRWVNAGYEVTVVTCPYDKSDIHAKGFISRQQIKGINLIVVNAGDSNRFSILKRAFRALLFALTSVYFALFEKYDVLLSSSGPITIGIPMIAAKIIRHKKTVFEVRDLWPTGGIELGLIKKKWQIKLALWFEKLCYKNADLIVPCSPGMEESIVRRFPQSKTLVITNASDIELFSNVSGPPANFDNIPKGHSIFLYAGSLGLMDDCSQIVAAMKHLKDQPISLVFVGDGAERIHLEKQATETNNPNIHFLGLIPKTEVVRWFASATASFVTFKDYPVLHTSSPNKMFDSFAAGIPIIQSTKGWIWDLVNEKTCGINVDPDNPQSFALAMTRLCNNKEERDDMAKAALTLAKEQFNRSILAENYMEAIKEIITVNK